MLVLTALFWHKKRAFHDFNSNLLQLTNMPHTDVELCNKKQKSGQIRVMYNTQ